MSVLARSGALLLGTLLMVSSARAATVTGEVIDSFCYARAGIRGPAHAQCGIRCARSGVPVGLLENGTRRVHVLLAAKDASPLPPELIAQMGKVVTIDGDPLVKGGTNFLIVRSFRVTR